MHANDEQASRHDDGRTLNNGAAAGMPMGRGTGTRDNARRVPRPFVAYYLTRAISWGWNFSLIADPATPRARAMAGRTRA